ncbi:pilin [Candidatus Uhrbacteria bacterium]|nr:pilin [Candidatus Uhrbacteria bacterium]
MRFFRLKLVRVIGALLPMLFLLLSSTAVSAVEIQVHCWCKKQTTNICNHVERTADVPISIGEAFARDRDITCAVCTEYCNSQPGDWTITHCEPSYREEICTECVADPASSCTAARGAHAAYSATCDPEATESAPISLGVSVGGIRQVSGLPQYINTIYSYLVSVILVVAIVMVVYGGFLYLTGAAGMGSIQRGKQIIKDAIVGMIIVLAAYAILQTINTSTTQFKLSPKKIECIAIPPTVPSSTKPATE